MTPFEIEEKYHELCNTKSDINYHLPKLRELADECEHVTEMGVRGCVSTYSFLSSKAKKVVAIDIMNVSVPDVDKLQFICESTLEIEIEKTDFLFIDTLHTYEQLKSELDLHAKNVNKYIGFHDTFFWGTNGENGSKGLNFAINEFLEVHGNWYLFYQTNENNGLTVIARK